MLDKKQTEQLYDIQNNSEWLLETLKATQEENVILKKALELACEEIEKEVCCRTEDDELFNNEVKEDFDNFIEQAKESINGNKF